MIEAERNNVIDIRKVQLQRHTLEIASLGLVAEVTRLVNPADKMGLTVAYLIIDETSFNPEAGKGQQLHKLAKEFGERLKRNDTILFFYGEFFYNQLKLSHQELGWEIISVPIE